MNNRSYCCPAPPALPTKPPPTKPPKPLVILALLVCALLIVPCAQAGNSTAPPWMHAAANAPLPPHDEKTGVAILYSEEIVTVLSADKVKTTMREVYKILRPDREAGIVGIFFNAQSKITALHGWCIPASGKDYEVQQKDSLELSAPNIPGAELISDVRYKLLQIPAAEPGNILGFEYEMEERPLFLQDTWQVQTGRPAHEMHYTLILPPGWEYKATWLNYPDVKPAQVTSTQLSWVVQDVKGLREEEEMPPFDGVAGHMIVSFFPSGGNVAGAFANWKQMGDWYINLTSGRRDASPAIKQKVAELTASAPTSLDKMKAIASFLQRDVRYVSIQLGIGGYQPHPASDIYAHHYGDCKDKATLMGSMLHEIGVDSYYVVINTVRGSVSADTPAYAAAFNHAILAIRLPDNVSSPSLVATVQHPTLGRLLFFDPTNDLTPFGEIGGYLQSNFGLLVAPGSGELVRLPESPSASNSIRRKASFTLSASGTLTGDVEEVYSGDRARLHRSWLRSFTKDTDRIKPIESTLANSLSTFQLTKATAGNAQVYDRPFVYSYTVTAQDYAMHVGDMLAVRPRVLGTKSSALLETKEPRIFPVEFHGPAKDTDVFVITLPPGYEVEDLPSPVDADFSFASYHSKSEVVGNQIRYTRTFEIKELSVPANRSAELKKFYRIIANDERSTALLRTARH
jgi:hypothetical protein